MNRARMVARRLPTPRGFVVPTVVLLVAMATSAFATDVPKLMADGLMRYIRQEYQEALIDYQMALQLQPNNQEAHLMAARCHQAMGYPFNYERAIYHYTQLLNLDPNRTDFYLSRGACRLKTRQLDLPAALMDFDRVLRLQPENGEAWGRRGECYRQQGKLAQALADCEYGLKLDPKNVIVRRTLVEVYMDQRDFAKALAQCDYLISLRPELKSMFLARRGACHAALGAADKAFADYNESLTLSPGGFSASLGRGNLYYERGDYRRAIADYDRAAKTRVPEVSGYYRPLIAEAYRNRGHCYYKLNEVEQALQSYIRAYHEGDDGADSCTRLAECYLRKGDMPRARSECKKALEKEPGCAAAHNILGMCALLTKGYDQAVTHFEAAAKYEKDAAKRQQTEKLLATARAQAAVSKTALPKARIP